MRRPAGQALKVQGGTPTSKWEGAWPEVSGDPVKVEGGHEVGERGRAGPRTWALHSWARGLHSLRDVRGSHWRVLRGRAR